MKPFMSQAPRPNSLSPRISGWNGSLDHSWPSTGTTSVWPDNTVPPSRSGPSVAKRFAFLPPASIVRRQRAPASCSSSCAKSIKARLEPRLVVSNAIRRRTRSMGDTASAVPRRSGMADHREELAARDLVGAEVAQHGRRHHRNSGLVHAARRHALMRRLDDDGNASRLQNVLDGVGDLRVHFLLHLEPARIRLDDARKLGNADHAVGGKIADMGAPDDRRQMVFAVRLEADVLQDDHVVVTLDLLKGAPHIGFGVLAVAREPFFEGFDDAFRRFAQALAIRIVSRPAQ